MHDWRWQLSRQTHAQPIHVCWRWPNSLWPQSKNRLVDVHFSTHPGVCVLCMWYVCWLDIVLVARFQRNQTQSTCRRRENKGKKRRKKNCAKGRYNLLMAFYVNKIVDRSYDLVVCNVTQYTQFDMHLREIILLFSSLSSLVLKLLSPLILSIFAFFFFILHRTPFTTALNVSLQYMPTVDVEKKVASIQQNQRIDAEY